MRACGPPPRCTRAQGRQTRQRRGRETAPQAVAREEVPATGTPRATGFRAPAREAGSASGPWTAAPPARAAGTGAGTTCSRSSVRTPVTPHPSDSERQAGSGLSFRVWKPADSMKREPRRLGAAVPSHVARLSSQALGPCLAPNAGSSGGFPSKRPWAPKTPPQKRAL